MDNSGFTQIGNKYLAMLYNSQLPYESRVLLFLVRKIIGFHKSSDKVSYTEITNATGIDRRRVIECIARLEEKGLIKVKRKTKCINIIELVGSAEKRTSASAENGSKLVRKSAPSKEKTKSVSSVTPLGEANLETKKKYSDLMEGEIDDEYE